jgi:hypothetical protein
MYKQNQLKYLLQFLRGLRVGGGGWDGMGWGGVDYLSYKKNVKTLRCEGNLLAKHKKLEDKIR